MATIRYDQYHSVTVGWWRNGSTIESNEGQPNAPNAQLRSHGFGSSPARQETDSIHCFNGFNLYVYFLEMKNKGTKTMEVWSNTSLSSLSVFPSQLDPGWWLEPAVEPGWPNRWLSKRWRCRVPPRRPRLHQVVFLDLLCFGCCLGLGVPCQAFDAIGPLEYTIPWLLDTRHIDRWQIPSWKMSQWTTWFWAPIVLTINQLHWPAKNWRWAATGYARSAAMRIAAGDCGCRRKSPVGAPGCKKYPPGCLFSLK